MNTSKIDLKRHVEKGTGLAVCIAVLSAYVIVCLVCEGVYLGVQSILSNWRVWLPLTFLAPVVLLALPCAIPARSLSSLRGEAIEVGPAQLPDLYECGMRFNSRLGLKSPLAIFVLQDNQINAFGFRLRTRNVVVLHDSLVHACRRHACRRPDEERTLEFILGHEMAHHALGHTTFPRFLLPVFYRKLSRLDEFSADAVAAELVGDRDVSARAITMLVVGPQILPHINLAQLMKQAREVTADRTSLDAEGYKTHPLLLRRLSRVI